jgi:hypothetical protein
MSIALVYYLHLFFPHPRVPHEHCSSVLFVCILSSPQGPSWALLQCTICIYSFLTPGSLMSIAPVYYLYLFFPPPGSLMSIAPVYYLYLFFPHPRVPHEHCSSVLFAPIFAPMGEVTNNKQLWMNFKCPKCIHFHFWIWFSVYVWQLESFWHLWDAVSQWTQD